MLTKQNCRNGCGSKAKENRTRSESEYSLVIAICYGDDSGKEYSLVINDPNKILKIGCFP
jgi:hypothetical protein